MIKLMEDQLKPVRYVLTADNMLQRVWDVDESKLVTTLQSINELGKHLLKAASEGNVEEVKSLLSQGSPFTTDWLGSSPLHLAAQQNKVEVLEVLLKGGISKDARNKVDRTPLHLAVYEGHYQASETLIKHGADINCQDMLSMTPLHWAVQNGYTDIVELLLRNGAAIHLKNKFDLKPQEIALQVNKTEIVELLQAYKIEMQHVAETLVMQLESEDAKQGKDNIDQVNNILDPVIIVEDNDFDNLDNTLENSTSFNAEESKENAETSKEPVVINVPNDLEDINSNFSQVQQKGNLLNSIPITNFKMIDGVIHPQLEEEENGFSAVQLLQEYGITMLPSDNDESNLLNAVMESGHSVVLTDVGKEVLNTVKQQEEKQKEKPKPKKIITVTPEQFLTLTNGHFMKGTKIVSEPMKFIPMGKTSSNSSPRRVVMKKSRVTPFSNTLKVQTIKKPKTELESVKEQLVEAKKTILEYKMKLKKKELDVQRYKAQLKLLMENS